ncbi:hypothetical protein [Engelhardtia mirabilis]|uniref:Uncharacterized protein n=1 Tax=Engelhardtia mirabilis TaxID=2528011 RepID=A0A518BI87_9BACT|nr:hypothetical protein Pla133_17640 [Planctomycetes bacterium Pla133]QDV01014.1 hypothetical protein Pla86_17630 [Planctomycetes bacterium Pla86]
MNIESALARLLLLVLPLSVFVGCSTTPREPKPTWREAEVSAPSENVLRVMSIGALERLGYKKVESDPTGLQITSGWRNSLAPFSGDGYRVMAEIEYEPLRAGAWSVRVRVKRQVNMSMVNPNDPAFAKWEWGPDDVQEAGVLLQQLRSSLDPVEDFKVGSEVDRRYLR